MPRANTTVVLSAGRDQPWAAALPGVVLVLALALGCQRAAPAEVETEPPTPTLPTITEMTADLTPLDLSPDPLPVGIAAAVDGEPITEEEIARIVGEIEAGFDSEPVDAEAAQVEAVLRAVESRLLLAMADQLDIQVSDEEIDAAIERLIDLRGITQEQLSAEVEALGQTWEEYRDSLVAGLVEHKTLKILGVYGPASRADDTAQALRERVVGCLRARAEVQVRDPGIELPENPFELKAEVGEVRFVGELAEVDEVALAEVAKNSIESRKRLCDAINSIELAVHEQLLERGYFEADVHAPWPADLAVPVVVEVRVTAGRPFAFGKVKFDQSAVSRSERVDETELRKRLAAYVAPGDVFTMSAYRQASEEISRMFEEAGIERVEATTVQKERKDRVVVDLKYRVLPADSKN